jgi:predicted transcriptional regulator of viral defense system
MNFIQFQNRLSSFKVFSTKDIEMLMPGFNKMNLVNWQRKNYIFKLRNGLYRFSGLPENELELFFIANKIYAPSYISLETALSYYGLIPEGVFSVQSVTTLKTNTFTNSSGSFRYHNIKESAFIGYQLLPGTQGAIRIACPEKAILDWFYLRMDIQSVEDIESGRLNVETLKETVDFDKLETLGYLFQSKKIIQKISLLKEFIYDPA